MLDLSRTISRAMLAAVTMCSPFLVDLVAGEELIFSATFRGLDGHPELEVFRLLSSDQTTVHNLQGERISGRVELTVVFDIGSYLPDVYISGMTLSYRGDGRTEYLRIGPGWNAAPSSLNRGYPLYAASRDEAEQELGIIRWENGTCKSSPRTLDENVRKWMICRAAFLQQPYHMHQQDLVVELFNGWFDGAYESWRMSQGALGFDAELTSYIDGHRSPELASSTLFQRRLARYELLLKEVNEADIKLFDTAISWANQGYPCHALKIVRTVKPRFIALSETYASSHINNVNVAHFEDAIVRWTARCAQSDDEEPRLSENPAMVPSS